MARSVTKTRDPQTLLPLPVASFHILLALVDGERHGYAIMKHVNERAAGEVRLGPGTLYAALQRLLDAQLVEEAGEHVDPAMTDARRRYYRITRFGVSVLRAEARRMELNVRAARRAKLLGPEPA
jgi:DNA-binding PadR family transcriptional regulator